jgi:hypothetical protein
MGDTKKAHRIFAEETETQTAGHYVNALGLDVNELWKRELDLTGS